MPLAQSARLSTQSIPRASTSLPNEAYVLSLVALPNSYAASSSSPADAIHLFDQRSLRTIGTIPGPVTALRAVDAIGSHSHRSLLFSTKIGSLTLWDDRTNSPAITMSSSHPILSFDVSPDGSLVAAGSELRGDDATLLYFDPRQPAAPLRTNTSTHSDDITSVRFRDTQIVLSASSDGLISLSNVAEPDEDESVVQVANWGCSISQCGFTPDNGVWAASDMETFSLWSPELDSRLNMDIREPSIHTQGRTWVTDYLINATPSSSDELAVFTGSNEGDVALISFPLSSPGEPVLSSLWTNGHSGVVRSLLWDRKSNVLLTGGEDSKLHLWPIPNDFLNQNNSSMQVDQDRVRRKRDSPMDLDEESGKRLKRS